MFVLDCSVALAWCVPDENDPYAENVLNLLVDQQAIVPTLWHLEVMNVLLMAQRRKRVSVEALPIILQTLSQLNIITDKRPLTISDSDFIDFSQQNQLTSYDASYLYLARQENIPIATLDKKLRSVAQDMGLLL